MGCEINECCFCIGLRTGCLIIGYLNLIMNIVIILILIFVLAIAEVAIANTNDKEFQDANVEVHTLEAFMVAVIVILLVIVILYLTFNIVLLVGLHKNKRGHVKAYLIFVRIIIVLSIIQLFGMFGLFGKSVPAEDIVLQLVNMIVTIYFYMVINSYHSKMDDFANKPAIYNTA